MAHIDINDLVRVKQLDDPVKNHLYSGFIGAVKRIRFLSEIALVSFHEMNLKQGIPWELWFRLNELEVVDWHDIRQIQSSPDKREPITSLPKEWNELPRSN